MSDGSQHSQRIDAALAAAAELLAARFGGTPELSHPENLGGSGACLVLRVRVAPNPFLQERSLVVKQLPAPGLAPGSAKDTQVDQMRMEDLTLFREVVAYQFTNTLANAERPGPQLLAYDIDRRMLILSDVGDGENFTDILTLKEEEDRRRALRRLGRSLGRMHTSTSGKEKNYLTLLRRQCQKHDVRIKTFEKLDIDISTVIDTGMRLIEENDIRISPGILALAREAGERQQRQELRAFTPFDLTPDNILHTDRVYFLDFEWAGFRDLAFDVACVIAGFPQDVSTPALTDAETDEFIRAWQTEVAQVWPEMKNPQAVEEAIMASLVGWAFFSLAFLSGATRDLNLLEEYGLEYGVTGDELKHLNKVQMEDLATTLESIRRFAQRHGHSASFTAELTDATSSDPAPQTNTEDAADLPAAAAAAEQSHRYSEVVDLATKLLKLLAERGVGPLERI